MSHRRPGPSRPYAGQVPRASFPHPAARPVRAILATAAAVVLSSLLSPVAPRAVASPHPPGDDPSAHLLAASRLPSVTGAGQWREVATGPEGEDPVGLCNRATLSDVGALEVVRRSFGARSEAGPVRAVQLVARFADDASAWRAREVLTAWGRDCEEWLDRRSARLGEVHPVSVPAGDAHAYAARHGERRASAFGLVRHGRTLTVIHLAAPGERARAARTPARVALRRIAHTFSPSA